MTGASIAAIGGGLTLLLTAATYAQQDFTWNGGGATDLWTNDANWLPGAPNFDLESGRLIFGSTGEEEQRPNNTAGQDWINIGGLLFNDTADAELTLTGLRSLSFDDGASITNDSTFLQTINNRIFGNGSDLTINAATGNLTFTLAINLRDADPEDAEDAGMRLTITGASDTTLTRTISGEGGTVFKNDTGVLTLSGFNTYDGGTTLNAGTIVLGNNRALGFGDSADLLVAGDGAISSNNDLRAIDNNIKIRGGVTLTFSGSNNLRLNGVISDLDEMISGSLNVNTATAADELNLQGDNTYTGGTTLTRGTIVLGHDNALGDDTDGMAILTLAGDDGRLKSDANDRTISNAIDTGSFNLSVVGATDLTLTGIISGTGGLTKGLSDEDKGTLTLTGVNTYTGLTTVNNGTLILQELASIGGAVDVNGGVFGGGGSMTGDLTNIAGTVAPGDGVGTLEVTGNYDQQADSTLAVEIDADTKVSDLLRIFSGGATLADDSTIDVSIVGDGYLPSGPNFKFTIIDADMPITDLGEGADISLASESVTIDLIRDTDFVSGSDTEYKLQVLRAADAYSSAAFGGNSTSIGKALDSLIFIADGAPSGRSADLLGQLDTLNSQDYNTAVRQLSPEPYNIAITESIDVAQAFTSAQVMYLAGRRAGLPSAPITAPAPRSGPRPGSLAMAVSNPAILPAAFWQEAEPQPLPTAAYRGSRWSNYFKVQGLFSDQDSSTNRTGYDATSVGLQAGVDYTFSPQLVVGLAFGYTFTDADLDGGLGEINDHTVRSGPYMSWTKGNTYVDSSLTFGYHFFDSTRNIPSLARVVQSDYEGIDATAYLGAGHHLEIAPQLFLTPTISLQYSYFDFDSFTESGGGGADLAVDERQSSSLRTRLGVNLSARLEWDWKLVPYLFLGWEHEFLEDDDIEATFASGGNPFLIDTGSRVSDSVIVGGGINARLRHDMSAFIRFENAIAADGDATTVAAGLSINF